MRKVLREGNSASVSPTSSSPLPHWVCGDLNLDRVVTHWRTVSAWSSGFTGAGGGEDELQSGLVILSVELVSWGGKMGGSVCLHQPESFWSHPESL